MEPFDPKALCGAKTRKGTPCLQRAGHGTNHPGVGRCSKHGGASPRAEVAGQVFLARREALTMGVPLDVEPHEAILECIRISAGEVQYASERIAELAPDEAMGPVISTHMRPMKIEKGGEEPEHEVQETEHGPPALHVWIQARHQAMDRLVTYSATALKAGVEQRQVEIAERQGQMIVEVIRGVVAELGMADHPEVPQIVRRQLTLVAGS
jgi:hypothetical protein